jgi:glycine/D-amino acid oxidase-like deaminating enzyme/nitrite reductase/ring-hydroxylating ferredoxin subunit
MSFANDPFARRLRTMQTTMHTSYWRETAHSGPRYAPLDRDLECDVAIIGGGITGLTAAIHLKTAGRRVALLEANDIGAGTTGHTTAHLDMTTDQPLKQLIDDFGEETAAAIVHASRDAIDEIEARCNQFGDCDFVRLPSYQYTEDAREPAWVREQYEAQLKFGLTASTTDIIPLPFHCTHAVRTENQGRFHAQRYLNQLAAQIHGDDCFVFEQTRAEPPEEGEPCVLKTSGGTVRAKAVFVATHSAFLNVSQWDLRVGPYQSYVIGVRVDDEIGDALFWDDAEPYHYIRRASSAEPDLLLIGSADHKTGQAQDERDGFKQLADYAAERFKIRGIEYSWSGEFFEPVDGLPYVGRVPSWKHVYIATGYAGTGMTLGTVSGKLVADLILERNNPLAEPLNPGRMTVRASAGAFLSENLNAAYRYVADRFKGEKVDSLDEIAPGTGRLITIQGQQRAAYREPSGAMHLLSPVCTHAGCIVQWNPAEKTWDCPCHGGRYTAEGKCFYGPPPKDLAPEELK